MPSPTWAPTLTPQMGIAFHQAMSDTCTEFEHRVRAAITSVPAGAASPRG